MVFISDIEGCSPASRGHEPQWQGMCQKDFFIALGSFLEKHHDNKVAFLGDYFDHGEGVVDSILGIISLVNTFNKEGSEPRVHIILGNRDLNKYRFIFEMNDSPYTLTGPGWSPTWDTFYADLPATPLIGRVKLIQTLSMGTLSDPPMLDKGLTVNQSNYLMLKIFSKPVADNFKTKCGIVDECAVVDANPKYDEFKAAVKQLFTVGRAVIYDGKYRTLLSHAGGVSSSFFHGKEYYDAVLGGLSHAIYSKSNYHETIEAVRKYLMIPPPPTSLVPFNPSLLEIYNEPVKKCAAVLFDFPAPYPSIPEYFLVQALGLKGDNGKPFASFINSCDLTPGCLGPIKYNLGEEAFFRGMTEFVNVISHGHVPNCTELPLVYRRAGVSDIIFIDNDTSNGYRPAAGIKDITNLPLAYVRVGGQRVGVFSIDGAGANSGSTYFGIYDKMVGEWGLADAPVHTSGKTIEYDGKTIEYDGKILTYTKPYTKPTMAGGYHKNRKNHRKSKKARQNKRRATRRRS